MTETGETAPPTIGPPPPGPLVCFPCLTNTCDHAPEVKLSSVHVGGYVPAVTALRGTLVCRDCAMTGAAIAERLIP